MGDTGSLANGGTDVNYVAFLNPDGSYGAVIFNQSNTSQQMSMGASTAANARFTVPANSIVTVVLGGAKEEAVRVGNTAIPSTKKLGCYRGTIDVEQLECLTQNFIDNPEQWHIAPDFFWYDASDASLTFLPLGGTYEVEIDKVARTLLASPKKGSEQGESLYVCGPAQSVGRIFYYPSTETLAENAIPMAEVESGVFEFTFVIGEQANDNALSFGFYLKSDLSEKFSGKTTAERYLDYDTSRGSNYFGLGKGISGHADGHIYRRQPNHHLDAGSRWTAVVDLRGGLKGAPVYVKEWEKPTGIEGVKGLTDLKGPQALKEECYDLSGRKVATVQKGVYIVRSNNASFKVLKR